MPQLSVENLTFAYPQGAPVLSGVSFSVEAGEFITLCGPSGGGKSTLLRHCKPALTPAGTRTGAVFFEGRPMSDLDQRTQSARIGYVQQSPEHQLVTDRVWHELAFGLESLGYDTPTIRRRVAEMASFFGIQTWFHRDTATLSGGQKQLLNLASVMAMGPAVLILDEPTSQLDPIAAGNFLGMLGKLNRELGTTIVLSEHRLEEALPLSDRVLVLDAGQLLCSGTPDQVGRALRDRHHPMVRALPTPMQVWTAVPSQGPCPVTVREGRRWLADYAETHPLSPLPPVKAPVLGEEVLSARGLRFRYDRAGPDVVKGLNLTLRQGELLAILGGNGTGKSTALGLLAGLFQPQGGTLSVRWRVGLLPQDPQALFVKKTVREDLQAQQNSLPVGEGEDRLAQVVDLCQLTGLLDRHPYDLSGGEQQRAALARVLLTQPEILLLDEPTKGLDPAFQKTLARLLAQLTEQGTAVVMVSHDVAFCAQFAHRCALFFDGTIVADDPPQAFFSGNSFYTTAANRMAREHLPQAVTVQEVIQACGGSLPPEPEEARPAEPKPVETAAAPAVPLRAPLSRGRVLAILCLILLIPLTLWWGSQMLNGRKYYLVSLLILLEAALPFWLSFEGRKPQARELILLATLCALGVIGRAAFVMLPQCKPVTALTVLTGVALGSEAGFLVGSSTMLVSNLLFGQGPWTPWQMAAMGLIGCLAGVIFRKGRLRPDPLFVCVFGGLAALVVYGGIMNPAAALMWAHTLNWELLVTYYAAGLPMDLIHGVSTGLFLLVLTGPFLEKLGRVRSKYGLGTPH